MIIDRIAAGCNVDSSYIELVARSASHRYKTYRVKKRTRGYRTIDHPARELKLIQSWLNKNIFSSLPVHQVVYSYNKGRNIRVHADVHRRGNYLMRLDFANFFPSIYTTDIARLLKRNASSLDFRLSKKDIQLITKLVCKDGRLTIGAPSSPVLSNAILFEFDKLLAEHCYSQSVTYSRYADDLYFSTNKSNTLSQIHDFVFRTIREMESPNLIINREKTVFTSRKRQRRVTGLILTSDKKVSLGRDRKRYIKGLVHKFTCGELNRSEISYLRGYLSYALSIEPTFIKSLENKYGIKTIKAIQIEHKSISRKKRQ